MPSGRIQRRIGVLLDEGDEAADAHGWRLLKERVDMVLALDPSNEDALALLAVAERGISEPIASQPALDSPAGESGPARDGTGVQMRFWRPTGHERY